MDTLQPDALKAIALWTGIVAFVMPLVVATVNQSHWRTPVKTAVAALSCLFAAAIELLLLGQFDTSNWALTTLGLLGGTITFFKGFWRPMGVADAVEKATNIRQPFEPEEVSGDSR